MHQHERLVRAKGSQRRPVYAEPGKAVDEYESNLV